MNFTGTIINDGLGAIIHRVGEIVPSEDWFRFGCFGTHFTWKSSCRDEFLGISGVTLDDVLSMDPRQ